MNKAKFPLVSILVPVYNVELYLAECLNSLTNQTLKNIEIVCVNDGSTDGSADILKMYAARDKRIVIVNKENGGLPSARNAGLDVARGLYVGFIDGDDYAAPDMFEKMYVEACKNKADIVVCGGHPFPDEAAAPAWLKDTLSPESGTYTGTNIDTLINVRGASPFIWRDLVSKKLIDDNNFRLDENIVVGEDLAFQFKIFAKANTVRLISDKLYYYRYSRPDSIMNSGSYYEYGSRILKHVNMIESVARSWEQMKIFKQNDVRFFDWAVNFIYWDIIKVTAQDRKIIAEKFCSLLIDLGYYTCVKKVKGETREHFNYINELCGKEFNEPVISVVAVTENCGSYLYTFLNSILEQTERDI
ncbi:MAG: glycosyltransferase, partial [Clostridia bacterium]|nr:glycosyltransferase [Clostridia bacterium]